jgi:hypothetical protein
MRTMVTVAIKEARQAGRSCRRWTDGRGETGEKARWGHHIPRRPAAGGGGGRRTGAASAYHQGWSDERAPVTC